MRYFVVTYSYSGSLAEFEGEQVGNIYKCTNRNSFREIFGEVYLPPSNKIRGNKDRFITSNRLLAIEWLIKKTKEKIKKQQQEIDIYSRPELKFLEALIDKTL